MGNGMKRNGMAYGTPKVVGHRNDKWNWVRPDGTLVLRGEWADSVWGFSQGWGCFQRKGDKKWNFVDADGRLLSDEWFVSVQPFGDKKEDPAAVKRGGDSRDEWNWIRPDGTYVLKDWAYGARPFSGGWGCLQRKSDLKWNFADAGGNLLSDEWFDAAHSFGNTKKDPASVKVNGRWHALYGRTAHGTADLSKKSVDIGDKGNIYKFSCGVAVVEQDGGKGYVDASLNAVGPEGFPFAYASPFQPETYGGMWAYVEQLDSEYKDGTFRTNLMGKDGAFAFEESHDDLLRGLELICENRRNPFLSAVWRNRKYRFDASDDWSEIARIGICEAGMDKHLDGGGGRLSLRDAWDRATGRMMKGIVASDSMGKEHFVCSVGGNGAATDE